MRIQSVAFVLVLLAAMSGCGDKDKNINENYWTINNPAAPSPTVSPPPPTTPPPGVVVTEVSVSTPTLSITLDSCPATINFTATVRGTNVTQTVNWSNTGNPQSFTSSGTSATMVISRVGNYTATATSTQANVSGTVTIIATGDDCDGGGGGGSNRTIEMRPPGATRTVGSNLDVDAICKLDGRTVSCSPIVWTSSQPQDVSVNSSTGRLTFLSTGSSVICAIWGSSPRVCHRFFATAAPSVPQCRDGRDNDGDGRIDFPADPGCSSREDNDERDTPHIPQCRDGRDNDGDGRIDFPADPGCSSTEDDNEADDPAVPQCRDGRDNDGDGRIDFPSDPGCSSSEDNDETDTTPPSVCAGASASLPTLEAKGQTKGFTINAPSGCKWALRSNNTHVVSTNPWQGTGPSAGTVTALNSGPATTIEFVVNPGPSESVVSSRTYVIP